MEMTLAQLRTSSHYQSISRILITLNHLSLIQNIQAQELLSFLVSWSFHFSALMTQDYLATHLSYPNKFLDQQIGNL